MMTSLMMNPTFVTTNFLDPHECFMDFDTFASFDAIESQTYRLGSSKVVLPILHFYRSICITPSQETLGSLMKFRETDEKNDLYVSFGNIRLDDYLEQELISAFNEGVFDEVTELDFSGMRLDSKLLKVVFEKAKNLKKLKLVKSQVDYRELSAMLSHSQVVDLDLSSSYIGDNEIAKLLTYPNRHLQTLNLEDNKVTAVGLILIIYRFPTLLTLHLSHNDLTSKLESAWDYASSPEVSRILKMSKLSDLNLNSNGIADNGVEFLAKKVLANLAHLTHLDMSNNQIWMKGFRHLLPQLLERDLQRLHLDGNFFKKKMAGKLLQNSPFEVFISDKLFRITSR